MEDPDICLSILTESQRVEETWNLLEMIDFGVKGAALAALGEMPAGVFLMATAVVAAPLGERKEGVKLGESTLNVFLD